MRDSLCPDLNAKLKRQTREGVKCRHGFLLLFETLIDGVQRYRLVFFGAPNRCFLSHDTDPSIWVPRWCDVRQKVVKTSHGEGASRLIYPI
jgi:hypothetical protein